MPVLRHRLTVFFSLKAPGCSGLQVVGEHAPYPIRSYVLRPGRITAGQAKALEKYWGKYGIEFSQDLLDLDLVFNRSAPRILEIGAGMGEVSMALAKKHPENDYLAIEVHRAGIGSLIRQAASAELGNIRVICHDVVESLKQQIPDRSLDEVYIFFPDPWPKKRHHKRRLISPELVTLLCRKLKCHARLFIATDWQDLAEHVLDVCDSVPGLINLAGQGHYAPRANWRPLTKFEQRGRKLGHQVWDFAYGLAPDTDRLLAAQTRE